LAFAASVLPGRTMVPSLPGGRLGGLLVGGAALLPGGETLGLLAFDAANVGDTGALSPMRAISPNRMTSSFKTILHPTYGLALVNRLR
jgi:hypothetical protein